MKLCTSCTVDTLFWLYNPPPPAPRDDVEYLWDYCVDRELPLTGVPDLTVTLKPSQSQKD